MDAEIQEVEKHTGNLTDMDGGGNKSEKDLEPRDRNYSCFMYKVFIILFHNLLAKGDYTLPLQCFFFAVFIP